MKNIYSENMCGVYGDLICFMSTPLRFFVQKRFDLGFLRNRKGGRQDEEMFFGSSLFLLMLTNIFGSGSQTFLA